MEALCPPHQELEPQCSGSDFTPPSDALRGSIYGPPDHSPTWMIAGTLPSLSSSSLPTGNIVLIITPEMPHVLLQILGRAENVIGFIRRGESEAWTEIHLSGGSGQRDVVILRKMKVAEKVRTDGTQYQGVDSTWRINGVPLSLHRFMPGPPFFCPSGPWR